MFLVGDSTSKMLDIMQRSMNAASMRADAINDNIANASTPNYKRKDITFQSQLERALASEQKYLDMPFQTTNEKHIPLYRPEDYRAVEPKVITEFNSYHNNNGNSVDIDKEMMEGTKNTMYFNALATRITKEFNKLKYILKSTT